MTYKFPERIFKQGNRYFIKIPFNVWEECGQKGLVPVQNPGYPKCHLSESWILRPDMHRYADWPKCS